MTGSISLIAPSMRRVERAAEFALLRCLRSQGLKSVPLPVPVEQWIEGVFRYDFEIADLTPHGANVLGIASVAERKICISQSIKHEGRLRFTAAHELGHMILHERVAPVFSDDNRVLGDLVDRVEREADRFAAAFLMPAVCVAHELEVALGAAGLALEEVDASILKGSVRQALRQGVLPRLARTFSVSLQAMTYRLSGLHSRRACPVFSKATVAGLAGLEDAPGLFTEKN